MVYNNWKNHKVTVDISVHPFSKFRITEHMLVKDLSEVQQQKYHDFLLSIKQQQEEFVDNFTFITNIHEEEYDRGLMAWKEYLKNNKIDDVQAEEPAIDKCKWQSSIEEKLEEEYNRDLIAWKGYLKNNEIDDVHVEEPDVNKWKWRSSIGEITLKDISYICRYDRILGAVFFVIDGNYELACLNDGRNLVKV
jgi:hypothetical protein